MVVGLLEKLEADHAHIPAPVIDIVAGLEKLKRFAFDGMIVTIGGVPLPAGKSQTGCFMVQRYRPLYGPRALPHLVYRRDPDKIAEADHSALGVVASACRTHIRCRCPSAKLRRRRASFRSVATSV